MRFHDQENMGAVEHATRKIQKMVPFAWAVADAAEASEDLSKRNHGHYADLEFFFYPSNEMRFWQLSWRAPLRNASEHTAVLQVLTLRRGRKCS